MIFIVGYSRSGTKMMNVVLQKLQIADAVPEIHFFEQYFDLDRLTEESHTVLSHAEADRLARNLLSIVGRIGDTLPNGRSVPAVNDAVLQFVGASPELTKLDIYRQLVGELSRYQPVDPTPRNVYYMDEIAGLIDDAKFIYMVRDPRDCILSQKRKWRAYWHEKNRPAEAVRLWLNYNPLLMALFWKNSFRNYERAMQLPLRDNLMLVQYEHMIRNPLRIAAKLIDFCAAGSPDIDTAFIRSDNADKWRQELAPSQVALVQWVAAGDMKRAGYELTRPGLLDRATALLLAIGYVAKLLPAFVANLGRMSNPIASIRHRLLKKPG